MVLYGRLGFPMSVYIAREAGCISMQSSLQINLDLTEILKNVQTENQYPL